MRYLIQHETTLSFPKPVREHQCELRLVPRADDAQRVLIAEIEVHPEAHLGGYLDCFGNRVSTLSLVTPHDALTVSLKAEVETLLANPFDFASIPAAEEEAWTAAALRREPPLWDFVLHRSGSIPQLETAEGAVKLLTRSARQSVVESMQEAMAWAAERFRYEPGATEVHAPLATFLEKGAGVCQDFAHLLVAVARGWGIPARYAMGYLDPGYAEREAGEPVEIESDPTGATHAWAEVLVPGGGWRGFDATQGLVVNDTYVTVAVGRDSLDAAPLRGSFKGEHGGESPRVRLRVARQQQQ